MRRLISKWTFRSAYRVEAADGVSPSLTIPADVVFSALLAESPQPQRLIAAVDAGALRISDALPFQGKDHVLPLVVLDGGAPRFLRQDGSAVTLSDFRQVESHLAEGAGSRILPPADGGLFLLADVADGEVAALLDEALEALSWAGIGARRSAGWGALRCTPLGDDLPPTAPPPKNGVRLLSAAALPPADALEGAAQVAYLPRHRRDRDDVRSGFLLAAGSVLARPYRGALLRLGNETAPILRYAHPFWQEVSPWNG